MTQPDHPTRLIALLGDPVAHSRSPRFQNAAMRAAGLNGVYVALRADASVLPGLLRGIAMAGGGGNVTVPHKRLAASLLDVTTDAVERTGACNTFWSEDGRVCGDNTDVAGFRAATLALLGAEPAGARVLVLGAGGAARAVLVGLAASGAARTDVANRTHGTAVALAGDVETGSMKVAPLVLDADVDLQGYDLVVNATSLGLGPADPEPVSPRRLSPGTPILDLVYQPGGTAWVNSARALGFPAADGREMLLHQGAAAFRCWWGVPAPLAEMRAALDE